MRELWEKVDTRTLEPGDVVVNYAGKNVVWAAGDSQIVNDNPAGPWHIPCLFRRIPDTEDPRVLRRALELASRDVVEYDEWGRVCGGKTATEYIEQARQKLESEADNG